MNNRNQRPGRPLGLTLAILLSALLYAFIPLTILTMQVVIEARVSSSASSTFTFEGETMQPVVSGGSSPVVTLDRLLIDGGGSLFFLVVCAVIWRGGRAWMRTLFTGTVLAFAGITAYFTLRVLLSPANLAEGVTSADALIGSIRSGQLTATILVPLYVLWYVNRAPARAFFRGYYLEGQQPAADL